MQRFGWESGSSRNHCLRTCISILFLETRLNSTESDWTGLDLDGHGRKDNSRISTARKLTFSLSHPFSSALFLIRMGHGLDMDP
jgi:hypothetical protein